MTAPSVVNKFATESEAVSAAEQWSKDPAWPVWSVIHAPTENGTAFFAERGDGGMVLATERLVCRFNNGKRVRE